MSAAALQKTKARTRGCQDLIRTASEEYWLSLVFLVKTFLFALLLLVSLNAVSQADIPPPTPSVVAVTKLDAFPGYRFFYSMESGDPKLLPLEAKQTVKGYGSMRLYVGDDSDARFEWGRVALGLRGATEVISIEDMHKEGKVIKVRYQTKHGVPEATLPAYKGASTFGSFVVSGLFGSLLLLRRRPVRG